MAARGPVAWPLAAASALLVCAAGCGHRSERVAMPTPTPPGTPIEGQLATQAIDPDGGAFQSKDGVLTVTVSSGAVETPTTFSIQTITNRAPSGVGGAYRLGPEGQTFSIPATLTFQLDGSVDLDQLTVAFQDADGYWLHARDVARDTTARTLTVTTTHFSDWTLVTGPTARDLAGTFNVQSSVGIPVTATGNATLTFAGEDAVGRVYLLSGNVSVPASFPWGSRTCSVAAPDLPTEVLRTNIAEVVNSPAEFFWGMSGHWNLVCSGSPEALALAFDTKGINDVGCGRGYAGLPVIGPDRVGGTYTIDCGTSGTVTGSWDFRNANCGKDCQPATVCHTGVNDCTTGTMVCADTGLATPGTSCGTNLVCDSSGVCGSCIPGSSCTPSTICYSTGTMSCSSGPVCVDGPPIAAGTSCGTNMVCNGSGTCIACTAGLVCTTQPDLLCHAGTTSCATGAQTCVNGSEIANGTSCGTNMVCNAGACVSCSAGLTCTTQPDTLCHTGVTSCATGTQTCVNGSALANGTSCGTNMVCNNGSCTSCTAGVACTTQPDQLCHTGITSCATGTSTCVNDAAVPNGTKCGTDMVCSSGACVCDQGAACTSTIACHTAAIDCSSGSPVCTDNGIVPPGTPCAGGVCDPTGACVPCTAGITCTPANVCDLGTTSCATGTETCTDIGPNPAANGTSCGTDMVCSGGACVCNQGAACTSTIACHTAAIDCSSGSPVCTDNGFQPPGTTCGTDLVCDPTGACVTCLANQPCIPSPNTCNVGTTSCATGTEQCTDTGIQAPPGTICAAGEVCDPTGLCVPCLDGMTCVPANPCVSGGTLTCSPSTVCNEGPPLSDGTTCTTATGSNGTCSSGVCTCTGSPCP